MMCLRISSIKNLGKDSKGLNISCVVVNLETVKGRLNGRIPKDSLKLKNILEKN